MPDRRAILRTLLLLVVVVQLMAFALWMLASAGATRELARTRAPGRNGPNPSQGSRADDGPQRDTDGGALP
jgi:hypothetical protein